MLRNLPGRGNLLRVRAQCLARETLVRLEVPKRTHLIRMLLDEGAVLDDGLFRPACAPHRLSDDSAGLDQAEAIIRGAAVSSLPVVYLSALEGGGWALRRDEVARLATDLGGVAQVVCEPSREFSFRLDQSVLSRIAALKAMSVKELKAEWERLLGSAAPNNSRAFLEARIAYRLQELTYGGTDHETRRMLDLLADEVEGVSRRKNQIADGALVLRTLRVNAAAKLGNAMQIGDHSGVPAGNGSFEMRRQSCPNGWGLSLE
ncbi:hypothetical protein LPB142_05415 [Rhodobacter xanthinilyticus]|uniref:Uncharacterized protein n=1 Tax=Rhodobacter xanthinilyticus TaxID=1850250 RepID=A0A1D9MAG2_9RHOB|nr:DUF2924 domain-containing protein [Rhodobacter xanthinilyticus]AOZ68827.1 hypothetical protein LPB142_05415 [Rhodobacter xanthinilyticus]